MTGLPIFRDSSAGMASKIAPGILLPKPPPQYSAMITRFSGSMPIQEAAGAWLRTVLCVEQCM